MIHHRVLNTNVFSFQYFKGMPHLCVLVRQVVTVSVEEQERLVCLSSLNPGLILHGKREEEEKALGYHQSWIS